MKYVSLAMVRDHMENIPVFTCPEGYTIRSFIKGDEQHWVRVELAAGEFINLQEALKRFEEDFGAEREKLPTAVSS